MHTICSSFATSICVTTNNVTVSNNSIIFYHFVGNFVPPEWRALTSESGKILSKTAKQLLSLIVFRLQIYHNNSIDELQETYCFFEQHLGVGQRRVKQCLVELEKSGFIKLSIINIVKYGIKCCYAICIKLIKEFKPYSQKFLSEEEKNFGLARKNIRPSLKKVSGQPEKNFTPYIDNNKDKSNKSRSSKSEEVNKENIDAGIDQKIQHQEINEEQLKSHLDTIGVNLKPAKTDLALETRTFSADAMNGTSLLGSIVANLVKKVAKQEVMVSSSNCSAGLTVNNKSWFKRKRLADFYPLSQEDADLLQVKSSREFNLNFINRLLLKLAAEYPDHHFGHKKVVLTYMAKALAHELRETTKANNSNFQFNFSDAKFKEQYLTKIENNADTSKEAQLKRKIAGIFEAKTAYELLSSCLFAGVERNQYQLKLLKNISLSEHVQTKILQQVKAIYGNVVEALQIIPLTKSIAAKQADNTQKADKEAYLAELAKQLDPNSVWYQVRKFLLERHSKYNTFSKLVVVNEDVVNKKIILQASSAFYDYYVRDRHMNDLEDAFRIQGFAFELLKFAG